MRLCALFMKAVFRECMKELCNAGCVYYVIAASPVQFTSRIARRINGCRRSDSAAFDRICLTVIFVSHTPCGNSVRG